MSKSSAHKWNFIEEEHFNQGCDENLGRIIDVSKSIDVGEYSCDKDLVFLITPKLMSIDQTQGDKSIQTT